MHSFQAGAGILWKELRTQALPIYLGGISLSIHIGKPIPFSADREVADARRILERAVRQLGEAEQNPSPS